ncbi:SH3 domain-containing protein [Streptomyces sp. 8P21H-1]|uniref:SH3 domain-containing protein n=1 Tax=Streptomyces sp. 8P21H-1 TaxID=2737048 RepID=UPI00157007C0|nr:SH3 domain-containing protein [Streptomyces sp. 8P21H-1]NSL43366.1 SH3 domain-containing protein [Streptomyces sp. 8P21H-1]
MSLRTTVTRIAITGGTLVAGGALVVGGASPVLATDDWGSQDGGHHDSRQDAGHDSGRGTGQGDHHSKYYKGRVSAPGGLHLRDKPTRGSAVIGFAAHGEVVSIFCKTPGEKVQGNPLWYLLANGTWAWGTARYIDNIGPAPRWC